jgi:hypothetical protein
VDCSFSRLVWADRLLAGIGHCDLGYRWAVGGLGDRGRLEAMEAKAGMMEDRHEKR